jgi:hypothetical protein
MWTRFDFEEDQRSETILKGSPESDAEDFEYSILCNARNTTPAKRMHAAAAARTV